MTDGRFAFTAAVRVVVRVHYRTAYGRLHAEMTGFTRFSDTDNFVFYVADLSDRRFARYGD